MKKKIVSLFVALVMVISMLPTYAIPAFAEGCDHIFTAETLPGNESTFWANNAHSHDDYYVGSKAFISAELPAGCETDGWKLTASDTTGFCMICGQFITEEDKVVQSKIGHNYSGDLVKAPTCTEAAKRKCSNKNYQVKVEQDPITKLFSASYVELTCEQACTTDTDDTNDNNYIGFSTADADKALGHSPLEAEFENLSNCEVDAETGNVVSTSCTETGTYQEAVYCGRTGCGVEISRTDKTVDPLGHDPLPATLEDFSNCEVDAETGDVVSTSCTETGTYNEVVKCNRCSETISSTPKSVTAHGHDYVKVEKKDATCTVDGWKEHYKCSICDKYFTDNQGTETTWDDLKIAATGHSTETVKENFAYCVEQADGTIVATDCVNQGSYDVVSHCTVCQEEFSRQTNYVDALGHNYEIKDSQDATCTEAGYKIWKCTRCLGEYKETEDALGHLIVDADQDGNEDWTIVIPATCESDGIKEAVCQRCERTLRQVINATGHNYQMAEDSVLPTCETFGNIHWICSNDNTHEYKEYKDPLGHQWDEGTLVDCTYDEQTGYTATTCQRDGYIHYVCQRDNSHTRDEKVVDALPHNPATRNENLVNCKVEGSEIVATSCTEKGTYDVVTYCTICDSVLSTDPVELDPLGHNPADAVEENHTGLKTDAATGEFVKESGKYVTATCTEDGSYDVVVYCSRCNAEISRETVVVEAPGHAQGNPEIENYTNIKLDGHGDPVLEDGAMITNPCNATGSYDVAVYCTRCNEELSRETIEVPATGHKWKSTIDTYPTCTTEGRNIWVCERCGENFIEILPALGHQWE